MSSKVHQRVELLANVAIIVVAVLFGYFLVQKFLFPTNPTPPPLVKIEKGTKVNISDVDWIKNQKTLILYVRKGCKYCTESMPFYKQLAQVESEKKTKLIVVSQDSENVSKEYLEENDVNLKDVRQASLGSIGVTGTPTLILVNEKGEVSKSWVGKLPSDIEKEVINQL